MGAGNTHGADRRAALFFRIGDIFGPATEKVLESLAIPTPQQFSLQPRFKNAINSTKRLANELCVYCEEKQG